MHKIKVSDYLAKFLSMQRTTHVFEVAGGMITHMLDSIYRLGNTEIVSMHHEQSAAFSADAYGRYTGRPGVAFATSGPGATNLLTGIGSCYFDSSPALFITGQVNTHEQKGERPIRQLGFQETDILSMARPITKAAYQIDSPENFASILQKAYELAMEGRPGPVLVDIPMNMQNALIDDLPIPFIEPKSTIKIPTDKLEDLCEAIQVAKRPLILAGNGVNCARAKEELIRFSELVNVPVVTSLLALDVIPFNHELRVGMIGSYGNRWANTAIGQSDLLIVIGSRLDIRQTGAHIEGFQAKKTIFHIDCEKDEINNRIKNCIPIVADVKMFLESASKYASKITFSVPIKWLHEIKQVRQEWPDISELRNIKGINPNHFMHELAPVAEESCAFFADVGNHQMWAAQSLELALGQSFVTTGGMGAMGFALPAAIGHCFASGKKPLVVIAGDGSFQMNLQEMQTIVRNKLPIKIIVLNNEALGMIRQFQDSYFEGRYQSTYWGYDAPDFSAIASAYGLSSRMISAQEEVTSAVQWLFSDLQIPALLQVMIDSKTNVYPKIAFGKPIYEMEPLAVPDAMEST